MISSIHRRLLAAVGSALLAAALLPACVTAGTYGRLIVRNSALPASVLDTRFAHTTPARSFLLVVTQPSTSELQFKWSVHCFNPARRESGGASGEVTITSARWVKQVRANWIKHPSYCTGSIAGSAAASPVLVRVFAQ